MDKRKVEKERGLSEFNEYGRATKYHQSPWDLKLTWNYDVTIVVGVSVNKTAANL